MAQELDIPSRFPARGSNVLEIPGRGGFSYDPREMEATEGPYQGGWHGMATDPVSVAVTSAALGGLSLPRIFANAAYQAGMAGAMDAHSRTPTFGPGGYSVMRDYKGGYEGPPSWESRATGPGIGTEMPSGYRVPAERTQGLPGIEGELRWGGPTPPTQREWGSPWSTRGLNDPPGSGPTRTTAPFSEEGPTFNYGTQQWTGGPARPTQFGPNAGRLFQQDPTTMLRPSDLGPDALKMQAGQSLFTRMLRDLANRLEARYNRVADVPKGGRIYETSGRRGPSAPGRGGAGGQKPVKIPVQREYDQHSGVTVDDMLREYGTPGGLTARGEPVPLLPLQQRPQVITTPNGRVLFSTGGGWSPRTEYDSPRITTPIRDLYVPPVGLTPLNDQMAPFIQRGVPTSPLVPPLSELFGELPE